MNQNQSTCTKHRLSAALSGIGHPALAELARKGEFDVIDSELIDPLGVLIELLSVKTKTANRDRLMAQIKAGEFTPTPEEWAAHADATRRRAHERHLRTVTHD